MNNLLSHFGLVDARISASEKDLPVKENGSYDYGIGLSLKGRLLYYEPIDDDIPNNDLSNVELEEVLNLKKQLVDVQPIDVHYLSIATTFIQLERYLRFTNLMFSKRTKKIEKKFSYFFAVMWHFVTIN